MQARYRAPLAPNQKNRTMENTEVTLWCDVDSDGSVNINDATSIQDVPDEQVP